ncbi:MAG TPA: hypothetical protein VGS58_07370 [Candidatus Sulfopaludibacter sp.]|nr:hypothetical protein [Candidatus Sulfopaludibacter sp.]
MSRFRFPLERVLAWRRTQLEIEEARYQQKLAAVAALDRQRAEMEAAGIQAEVQVRAWKAVSGEDLAALAEFRQSVRTREKQIAARRAEAAKTADAQLAAMLEARRRCRLLERLKERRQAEWQAADRRALEELAAESYLARWNREHA